MTKFFTWRTGVLASFVIFSVGILSGMNYWLSQTEQWRQYQLGWLSYRTSQYVSAVEYFDVSYSEYQKMRAVPQSTFTAPPSLEIAELSQHFKALALVKQGTDGSVKLAVLTFKEALKLTTSYAMKEAGLDQATVAKLERDRSFTQQDLEILFHNQPQQAKKEGKGRGDKAGEKQSEDPAKGNPAGKQDRESL